MDNPELNRALNGGMTIGQMRARIVELETLIDYLNFFHRNADFGPAHTDVVMAIQRAYEKGAGKPVPATWKYE